MYFIINTGFKAANAYFKTLIHLLNFRDLQYFYLFLGGMGKTADTRGDLRPSKTSVPL